MYDSLNNLFVVKFIGILEINFINLEDNKYYYIRENKFKVSVNKNGKYLILNKKNFGDKIYY